MGTEGFDGKERTTIKGKVQYRRKTHNFDASAILRIITKYNNEVGTDEARQRDTAIKLRAIFIVAGSLFANVDDMFDKPISVSDNDYNQIKEIWREGNDEIVDIIATYIGTASGSPGLAAALSTVGRMINRGMEYLFTGSTDF